MFTWAVAFWISVSAAVVSLVFYWLARIIFLKVFYLPFRHFLELSVLVFPLTFGFCLILIGEIWAILFLTLFLLVIGALEIFLRRIVEGLQSGQKIEIKYGQGRNGVQVKYPEALIASGDYPRHYMTRSFFQSIQYSTMYERELIPKSKQAGLHYDLAFDYQAPGINVVNGLRTTTDQPKLFEKSLLFFGGSTTFGAREVPDDLTFSSFVQRKINENSKKVRVINHGQGGATVVDRVNWLISETPVKEGDIIVFYFGANDCGWLVTSHKRSPKQSDLRSPLLILARRLSDRKVEILNWFHGELVARHNLWCAKTQFKSTVREFDKAKKWAETRNCKFLIVLQPHLYVSKTTSHYEESLRGRFSSFLRDQLRIAYPLYESFVGTCGYGVSASHVLNDIHTSVYVDWCHVNARGNETIANFLYDSLNERGWLN
jgi:lysophospholipase L1-like esterase